MRWSSTPPGRHDTTEEKSSRKGDLSLLKVIWPYVVREKGSYVAAVILLPFSVLLPLLPPRLVKGVIDETLALGWSRPLFEAVGLLLAVILADLAVRATFHMLLQTIGLRIIRRLRADLFARLQLLPLSYFRHEPRGRIVARLTTDLDQIDQMFASGGLMLISDCFLVIGIAVGMFLLSPRMALTALAVLPFMLVLVAWLRDRMREVYRDVRRMLAQMNAFTQEALSAHEVIALLDARPRFRRLFEEQTQAYQKRTLTANAFEAGFFAGIDLFGSLSVALVMFAGLSVHAATAGLLIAMTQYVQQFFVPLRGLATRFATFQQAMVALERVEKFLALPVEETEGVPRIRAQAEPFACRDLEFRYRPDKPVLRGASLEVAAGEHVALIGETGSGKSTLARILVGFYSPDAGGIHWGGRELREMNLEERRSRIMLVPQEVFLFDTSIEENIRMGRDVPPERMKHIVSEVGLDQVMAAFGPGSEGLGEWGRRISEGEKQLIAAARIIAHDPALVILDEATSALDPISDARVRAAIRQALTGRSAIIIAHRLSTLEAADRIAVMHHGRVVEQGRHDELIARSGIYNRLYRLLELSSRAGVKAA